MGSEQSARLGVQNENLKLALYLSALKIQECCVVIHLWQGNLL
ncbi:Uncharacterised protein [Vibrio cholerae]|nr:Uncharacterised protein [Vibrio cholerae]